MYCVSTVLQAVTEVLNKSHYSNSHLEMRQNPITLAEDSGQSLRFEKVGYPGHSWVKFTWWIQPWTENVRFFFKSQTLTPGSFAAICPSKMHSATFERPIFFLKDKILKKCIETVLKGYMLAQSYPLLLHKIAFQSFWVPVTVYSVIFIIRPVYLAFRLVPFFYCTVRLIEFFWEIWNQRHW